VIPALATTGLTRRFGGLVAVDGVSLAIPAGARHALIGPNGAGKTTLINLLTGVLAPSAGDVSLRGERITALAQHQRVKLGLARTFQVSSLFPGLTVAESVMMAVLERRGVGGRWLGGFPRDPEALEEAAAIIGDLGLAQDGNKRPPEMAYGQRRLLEIALALATKPKVLLLDEPAAGIPSRESIGVLEAIAALPREVTVLFIEHDMNLVFRFAERITVMVGGRVLAEGTPAEIARDERVKAVYLGREASHG